MEVCCGRFVWRMCGYVCRMIITPSLLPNLKAYSSSLVIFKTITTPSHPTPQIASCVSLLLRIPCGDRNRIGRYPSRMTGLVGMYCPR